jgi:conjugal transfer pilus assembly protein TraE
MDFDRHQNDLRTQRRANRTLGAIVAMLSLSQLLSLAVIVAIVGSERTVIVPPSIDRTFWITRDKASREYLEQMAGYVSWLMLDVSPSTVDWKRNVLLNWTSTRR